MKRILIFLLALLLLLTACTQKPSDPTLQETTPQETTPNVTTPENTTPEVTTPPEPPHEHLFGEATVTKEPTCVQNGTRVAYCSCGESEETEIPATGRHRYMDNVCEMCQKTEILLIPVSSNYDADGDGEKDVYYFATEPAQRCASGTWIWAGNYDSNLSQNVSKSSAADVDHWYVEANSTNKLVYRISVPESGVYEMILHMRLKDGNERGAKYTFNEGTAIEQVFQTSHAFDSETLKQAQNETVGTYMYGIYVYLQSGENIFSIECASQSSKTQHFREFFFVKDQAEHSHNFESLGVTKQPTCNTAGEQTLVCDCGESQAIYIPKTGEHIFKNGTCTLCGEADILLYESISRYDADGDGQKDVYYFSTELNNAAREGIHLWAGNYNAALSTFESPLTVGGHQHFYVSANSDQQIVYYVTVPEAGVYEMILHMRLKDGAERGAKYFINEGTDHEQIFETSHAFDEQTLALVRNETVGTYMYGIRVNLVAGQNTIKITAPSKSSKTQHFRDFYFVKIGAPHQHDYCLRSLTIEPTCTQDGEVAYFCYCGQSRVMVLPATYQHTYIEGICTVCGQEDLGFGIIEYDFLFDKAGFAGGTISFITEGNGMYKLYWADENGCLPAYTYLGSFEAYAGRLINYTINRYTAIPKGATRLMAVNVTGIGKTYSFDIPEERLFTAEELYTFGAISDTHQGTRYGPESLSYDRLVNAGRVLSEKNAILVGIDGDITYINLEFEYVLHADAVKEIFEFAPDMPIFTTTGNHESRDPYPFSKEMYLKYTRDLVEYDSDFSCIYSDGNDLDYVVELPDGSVIIFLHQVYYDYGKPDSRLMEDYQLDWLGNRLEQYKDSTVFLFFHSQMQDKVGDFNSNDSRLDMGPQTEDYKRLDAYFKQYTNVIFFNGHSHNNFEIVFSEQYGDRLIDTYGGEYATLVHIPSLGQLQLGHIVHVYEDYIVFEGYHFGNEKAFSYATFIIEK